MIDLSNKKALVTGATGGIGGAIARALHACGAHVICSGTNAEALAHLHSSLKERCDTVALNLADMDALVETTKRVLTDAGAIDILVNNAGVTMDNLAIRMTDEAWETVLRINLTAAFKLTQLLLPPMMKNRWGRVINITSVVGHMGNPGQANYVAAKAGLTGLTKTLALEYASRGVTVNAIAPGFIETKMTDKISDAVKARIQESIPMGRMGTPEDITGAACFLASSAASYITGQTIHINGGMYC